MKIIYRVSIAVAVFVAYPAWLVQAGDVTIPHTFEADTPAIAAEVNANFNAIADAVNDNSAEIATIKSSITALQSGLPAINSSNEVVIDVVRDCAADNSGVNDAAPAIQECLNLGGHVRVPAGTYSVHLTAGGYALQIMSSNTVLELSTGAVIRLADSQISGGSTGRMLRIGDGSTPINNVRITGTGTFDGNKSFNGPVPVPIDKGAVVYFHGPVSDSGVYDINIVDGVGDCIWVEGVDPDRRSKRITIDGTNQSGCREGTVWVRADGVVVRNNHIMDIEIQDGIEPAQGASNWSIENNYLENVAQSGVDIFTGANNGQVVNNVLVNTSINSGDAITVGGVLIPVRDVLIDGNVISGTGFGHGISTLQSETINERIKINNNIIYGAKLTGIRIWGSAQQVTISGNSIYENGEDGIYSRGSGVLVSGNHIYGNNKNAQTNLSGIRLQFCSNVLVSDNRITNTTSLTTQEHGIFVQSGTDHIQIVGNQVSRSNAIGILLKGSDIQVRSNTVFNNNQAGNAQFSSSQGIWIEGDRNTVQGNEVFDDQAIATQTWGILATASATSSLIEDNVLRGHVFGEVIDLSGNATIRRNSGYATEKNGTATILAGTTSITVNHGIASTPSLQDVQVTPINNLGDALKFWVSGVTATQFTINLDTDPGVATAAFSWSVIAN